MSKSKLDLDFFKKEVFMAPKTVAIIMDGNGLSLIHSDAADD